MLMFMVAVWLMIVAVLKMIIDEPVGMEIPDVGIASRFLCVFVLKSPSLLVRVALAAVRWNNMVNIIPQII